MIDDTQKPWVNGSDEDIISAIVHGLRYEAGKPTRQAEQLAAQAAAARILENLKRGFVITPKRDGSAILGQ